MISVLYDIYPFELTLSVVSTERYLPKFRSAFVNLMMSLHIDKEPL